VAIVAAAAAASVAIEARQHQSLSKRNGHPFLIMQLWSRKKVSAAREREERLRQARSAAKPLRSAYPSASLVNIQLRFLPVAAPPHAAQSFALYPGAQAFFSYPCPYGDCDGIFELAPEAQRVLSRDVSRASGTLKCAGVRSRDGLQRQPCGLCLNYTISASHES
jgi:hypothetical protein